MIYINQTAIVCHNKGWLSTLFYDFVEEIINMWQYILYFILGGSIVALVAYLANHSNQLLTILVGNLPVLFLLNVIMVYSAGGATSGIAYARGALISLPFFIIFVLITILILPRITTPVAILPAMLVYIIPSLIYHRRRHRIFRGDKIAASSAGEAQMNSPIR